MKFIKYWNDKIKKLNIWDLGILKFEVAAATILLAKYWQPLTSLDWYWYAIVVGVGEIYLAHKIFSK